MMASGGFGPHAEFWLMTDDDSRSLRIGGDGLAVFSGEGEAELFRCFGLRYPGGRRWRVHRTSAGELVSMLHRKCRDVEVIYLDPTPDLLSARLGGLIGRHDFIERVTRPVPVPTSSAPVTSAVAGPLA